MAVLPQTLRKFWSRVAGENPSAPKAPEVPKADVIVHNPAAKRAHDLDDPFFDDDVQARMADVIAGHAKKKSAE
jgi:hypothetical protein